MITTQDEQPITLSIFGIQKLLSCAVGDIVSAKKLRNGSVLAEVRNKRQADAALNMTTWVSQSVKVTPHRSLNTSRGVIRCREFRDCDDTEVLNALSSQGVSDARRLMSKRNGVLEPTNTFLLTFALPTPPKLLKAAYMKIDVEAYFPNPLRCYNCQHYGHGKATCNRKAVCAKCSQEGHQDADCVNPPHCANCAGNHSAYSRDCPEWAKQKEITQVKFGKNISFGDAKKIVEQRTQTNTSQSNGNLTYAKVTAPVNKQASVKNNQQNNPTQTIEIQTDLTWPNSSDRPFLLLPSKSTAEVQTDTSVHTFLGPASGEQAAPTPPTAAHKAAGGLPPPAGAKPSSKSSTPAPPPPTTAAQLKKVSSVALAEKSKPGPASSKSCDKQPTKSNFRPPKGTGDPVKLANRYTSLDEMAMDLGGAPSSSPIKGKFK